MFHVDIGLASVYVLKKLINKLKNPKKSELLNGCYICLSPSSTSYYKLS